MNHLHQSAPAGSSRQEACVARRPASRPAGKRRLRRLRLPVVILAAVPPFAAVAPSGAQENAAPVLGGGKVLAVARTAAPPVIDGVLDDAVWESAPSMHDMHQFEPVDQSEPSERTEVYILYDSDNLYVAARMWDSEPEQITARQMVQGGTLRWDDSFGIYVDPFNNKRTGYNFQVNPNSSREDGMFETPTRLNRDWDGVWFAEAAIDERGWTAELAIPFKTLNFNPDNPDWGFTVERTIARRQEEIAWVSFNRQVNPGTTGTITGLTGLRQGRGLDVVPTVVTSGFRDYVTQASDSSTEPALDIFYNFTPSLSGVLTMNTDFSATEVDDRQINLTRFSLFFPEKRDFFLQDVDIFSFGGLQRNGIPFFSRRIGLGARGQPVDLDVGAKLTGRVGRWNIGVLDIRQDEFQGVDSANLFVGRVAANVLEESSVGMIFTHGDPRSNLGNSVMGVDFRYRNTRLPGGRTLAGEAWYQQSDTEGAVGGETAWGVRLAAPNNTGLRAELGLEHFGDQFNPALGFVNRRGIERREIQVGYTSRPIHPWARAVSHGAFVETYEKVSGELESERLFVELIELETNSGDEFSVNLNHRREILFEEFEVVDGTVIPVGDYDYGEVRFEIAGASERVFAPGLEYSRGEFFNGDRVEMAAQLEWRPGRRLLTGIEYEYNDIELPGGRFITRLIAVNADVAFNVRWSWLNLLQYDNESESVGINSRLRWNPRAGQDLFIVVNHGYSAEGSFSRLRSEQSRIAVKYTHTFRF